MLTHYQVAAHRRYVRALSITAQLVPFPVAVPIIHVLLLSSSSSSLLAPTDNIAGKPKTK
jgi:hypothetical protein